MVDSAGRDVGTLVGEGLEKGAQLCFDVGRLREGLGDGLAEQLSVALAQAMDRHPRGGRRTLRIVTPRGCSVAPGILNVKTDD